MLVLKIAIVLLNILNIELFKIYVLVKGLTISISKNSELSAFNQIIQEVGMFDRLLKLRNITIIAPTNAAYQVYKYNIHKI